MSTCPRQSTIDAVTMWSIAADSFIPVTRIRYGVTPPGFREMVEARPLVPGCYVAEAVGPSGTAFDVHEDGSAAERKN